MARGANGTRWLAVGGVIAGIALLVAYAGWNSRRERGADAVRGRTAAPAPPDTIPGGRRLPLPPAAPFESGREEPDDGAFATSLQERFGDSIFNSHTQIKAIEKLIAYLMHFYPDDWRERVYDFLKQAFPDLADALYAKFEKLTQYNDWLREERDTLATLPHDERRDTLWRKRYETFGDDAYEIWQAALKNEQIHTALETIRESPSGTVADKFDFFMEVVRGTYGEEADAFIQKRQTELMNQFLSVETVQDDLHAMSAAERQQHLRDMRQAMGLDEAALERWEHLDRERDHTWVSGEQYMRERAAIAATSEGDAQRQRLRELQDRAFGPEADTIRAEEEAGFYRFGGRRRIGRE